jgi:hypothetical protein
MGRGGVGFRRERSAVVLVSVSLMACGASTRSEDSERRGDGGGAGTERAGSGGAAGNPAVAGGSAGLAAAGRPEDGAASIGAWDQRVNRVACEREVRCGRFSAVERCMEWRNEPAMYATLGLDAAYASFFGGVDTLSYLATEYRPADEATLQACLDEITAGACDPSLFRPAVCEGTLVPKAPRAAGDACSAPSPYLPDRPCEKGLDCICGACLPVSDQSPAEGEPCEPGDDCEPGFTCLSLGSAPARCAPTPALGEPCSWDCTEGACSSGVCLPIRGLGEICNDTVVCQFDLTCAEGRCVVSAGLDGAPCTRDPGQCLRFCVFPSADANEGTCGVPSSTGPTPCSTFAGDGSPFCPAGTYRAEPASDPNDCSCLPHLALGAACNDQTTFDAWQAPCGDAFCSNGTCVARYPAGSACVDGSECAVGLVCDTTTRTCAAPECAP